MTITMTQEELLYLKQQIHSQYAIAARNYVENLKDFVEANLMTKFDMECKSALNVFHKEIQDIPLTIKV